MKMLSEIEYLATMAEPMKRLEADAEPPFDFWEFFDAIPPSDFEGHDCSAGSVSCVLEHSTSDFLHVLVDSEDTNVFMVLVLELACRSVLGHRLLDFESGVWPKGRLTGLTVSTDSAHAS